MHEKHKSTSPSATPKKWQKVACI